MSKKNKQLISEISAIITNALSEDIGAGDITSQGLFDEKILAVAHIISKERMCIVCGVLVLREIFNQVDTDLKVVMKIKDGDEITKGTLICSITGKAASILKAERVALNFLGRLSGIATKTHALMKKVKKYKTELLDTRKTTPGLRILEKYAVRIGGGVNHRFGLFDQVLIKDTHIDIIKSLYGICDVERIVEQAKRYVKSKKIVVVEVADLEQLKSALRAKPDRVLLDNMSQAIMKKAVKIRNEINPRVKLEASGNISEKNIAVVALSGVDYISLGMLTHSVENVDFTLKIKTLVI